MPNVILDNQYFKAEYIKEKKAVVCASKSSFIPEQEFKQSFELMGEFIKINLVDIFVFDKESLKTFHQASMVWYHVNWKPRMFDFGLRSHRKILPQDSFFKKSVEIGRQKIKREHPGFDFERYDIRYFDSLAEALQG